MTSIKVNPDFVLFLVGIDFFMLSAIICTSKSLLFNLLNRHFDMRKHQASPLNVPLGIVDLVLRYLLRKMQKRAECIGATLGLITLRRIGGIDFPS